MIGSSSTSKRTPFTFLLYASDEMVDYVHRVILSPEEVALKHQKIVNVLQSTCTLKWYHIWTMKKRIPPIEMQWELTTNDNSYLYKMINEKLWLNIGKVFAMLTPATQQLSEEWLSIVADEQKLREAVFIEAKEILTLFLREQGNDSHNEMNKLTEQVRRMNITESHSAERLSEHGSVSKISGIADHDIANVHKTARETIDINLPADLRIPAVTEEKTRAQPIPPSICQMEQNSSVRIVDPKNVFNIILLGETGVGKTTFVNSIANYVEHGSLNSALENPVILIDTSFFVTGIVGGKTVSKPIHVEVKANCNHNLKNSGNEKRGTGSFSRTQDPLIHQIYWKENGTTKLLRIIDTPGVNDTGGVEQDKANFDKIFNLVGKVGYLNAVCVVLKPNESILSPGFKNCLDNVLVKLHRNATKNILFCFTNARATSYRVGDTIAPLSVYLNQLKESANIHIGIRDKMFCFDNEGFRYICTLKQLPHYKAEDIQTAISKGWLRNIEECKKLLTTIQGLVAHQVSDTVNINNTLQFLTAMAKPISEIVQNVIKRQQMVEAKIAEITELKEKGDELKDIMTQTQIIRRKVQLDRPRTVCTATRCPADNLLGFGYALNSKKICHDPCFLDVEKPLSLGNERMKNCDIFNKQTGECRSCGCLWNTHRHIDYEIVESLERVATQVQMDEFNACQNVKQRAEHVLSIFKSRLENIENEYTLIKETSCEFSAFLQFSSLKPGMDPYLERLRNLVEMEESMSNYIKDGTLLLDWKLLLKEYRHGVALILMELRENKRSPLTTEEIWRKIDDLSKLPLSGNFIFDSATSIRKQQQKGLPSN